ncbi:MAG TPA: XRE family transcriptional regulator [Bosea sp. (in: a-proteobacteria)]|jgi:transcriptional regulator with XRE-family HTH domain|uniref:helix-turn-helix domain-containing protein n=1 Tax=Bosea sp. (in: a-proteobacteria) TaxID=1871050 RepID=UPI002E0DD8F6|nr:XRE family transcriptional regulator [Bosea sp. (in: a-proteobacteria)]
MDFAADISDDALDRRLGARLKAARLRAELTLDGLAKRTGVSRAMISRVERGESSPTAALLVRLGSGLGLSLSALLDESAGAGPLARRGDQAVWRDPASGYLRRNVSPYGTGSGFEIVEVVLPPGAQVELDSAAGSPALDQQIWVLDGALEVTLGETVHPLSTGDCLQMHLRGRIAYRNRSATPVRYAVILAARGGSLPDNAA